MAEKMIPCAGLCGAEMPVSEISEDGQKSHVSAWVCGECHYRLCSSVGTCSWNNCGAERAMHGEMSALELLAMHAKIEDDDGREASQDS